MIIEYYGLPGSGKTYKATNFAKTNHYLNFYKFKYSFFGKFICKILFKILEHNRNFINQYAIYIEFIKKNELQILSKNFDKYIFMLSFETIFYLRFSKKNVILDEGLIQIAVTLFYENNWNIQFLRSFISLFQKLSVQFVYVDTPIEKCLENIEYRKRHVCDIDKLKKTELKDLLSKEKIIFDEIKIILGGK